jgi:hypothetical protein
MNDTRLTVLDLGAAIRDDATRSDAAGTRWTPLEAASEAVAATEALTRGDE